MSSKSSENSKSYKTATIFFAISGLIFIILSGVSGIYFLPIGIALIIISILFWQRSKYLEKK
jgi:drug/metabolite transporter (DMT)-like permease